MKITLFLLAISSFVSLESRAYAAGSDFPFQAAGMRWSQNLGNLSNTCVDQTGKFDKTQCNVQNALDAQGNFLVQVQDAADSLGSRAAQECLTIGGHLPTISELQRLIRAFGHSETRPGNPVLDSSGQQALAAAFSETQQQLENEWFWSASVKDAGMGDKKLCYFQGYYGDIQCDLQAHVHEASVRCVAN